MKTTDRPNLPPSALAVLRHYLNTDGAPWFPRIKSLNAPLMAELQQWCDEVFCPIAERCGWIPATEAFDAIAREWLKSSDKPIPTDADGRDMRAVLQSFENWNDRENRRFAAGITAEESRQVAEMPDPPKSPFEAVPARSPIKDCPRCFQPFCPSSKWKHALCPICAKKALMDFVESDDGADPDEPFTDPDPTAHPISAPDEAGFFHVIDPNTNPDPMDTARDPTGQAARAAGKGVTGDAIEQVRLANPGGVAESLKRRLFPQSAVLTPETDSNA